MGDLLAFFACASKFKSEFGMSALSESRKAHGLATNGGGKQRKPRKCLAYGKLVGFPSSVFLGLAGRGTQGSSVGSSYAAGWEN